MIGKLGQPRQREGDASQRPRGQRVVRRHDHAVGPLVAGQRHQVGVVGQRFGGHADVGFAGQQQFGHLLGRALVQAQRHLRVHGAEVAHGWRQRIARLRVRGGDRQDAAARRREVLAGALQVVGLLQQSLDDGQHRLARRRQVRSGACRRARRSRSPSSSSSSRIWRLTPGCEVCSASATVGEVEALADGLPDGAQLLEVHGVGRRGAIVIRFSILGEATYLLSEYFRLSLRALLIWLRSG